MQKTLFIKLSIIAGLCLIFTIGLTMFSSVISERQNYADSVVREIAQQHVNPQEIITPFIAIPTTVTPECLIAANSTEKNKCATAYSTVSTVFATQTMASQDLAVSNETYQRGIYHATSYEGDIIFDQRYSLTQHSLPASTRAQTANGDANNNTTGNHAVNTAQTQRTQTHWDNVKLIIPVSDLRGVATLPTVTIGKQQLKATYPQDTMIQGLSYVEVALPQDLIAKLQAASLTANTPDGLQNNATQEHLLDITVNLPLSGINHLNTVPTGQNFELVMRSNWHAPNFIGKALPNAKDYTSKGFEAKWQNQYLTVANNQYLSKCLSSANNECTVTSRASLNDEMSLRDPEAALMEASMSADSLSLNSFGVSFAEPNDVYLQTERTMKYALLLILVSFGTFFLFEIIKSSRIHPIQYLLVGCALLVFYVLLLPLAEQIVFWQAYAVAASACVGLIGWYTYYVLGSIKRAAIFTAILAGLYASFYGILTVEDLNLLLGAVFCFVLIAAVMGMTRKIDWYQVT